MPIAYLKQEEKKEEEEAREEKEEEGGYEMLSTMRYSNMKGNRKGEK